MTVFVTVEVQQMKYFQTDCLEKLCAFLKAFTLFSGVLEGYFFLSKKGLIIEYEN